MLDFTAQSVAEKMNLQDRHIEPATVKGFPARDINAETTDGDHLFGRLCLVRGRLYNLRAVYTHTANRKNVAERAQRFFNSFTPTVK